DVEADGFGIQPRTFTTSEKGPLEVTLLPVGTLTAHLVADDPAALKDWNVRVWTYPLVPQGSPATGYARGRTDAEGSLVIPRLAEGRASFSLRPPEGVRLRPLASSYRQATIEAGRERRVEIQLVPTVTLEGVVREQESGQPVAGVRFSLTGSS